jgi:hypothetical protein
VLAGQPELADRLNHQSLRQLKQRVGLRCFLKPLDLGETGQYITSRVRVAGGMAPTLFTREAVCIIHESSRGIPRTISVICHNSLISGFATGRRPVTADVVREVCRDFDFEVTPGATPEVALEPASIPEAQKQAAPAVPPNPPPAGPRRLAGDLAAIASPRRRFFSFF